jgi:hypothetical protein
VAVPPDLVGRPPEGGGGAAGRAIAVLETLEPGRQLTMAYSNQAQLDMLAARTEAASMSSGGCLRAGPTKVDWLRVDPWKPE